MMNLPLNILPAQALPPLIAAAAQDLANNIQVPLPLAVVSLMSVASLACQDKIQVALPSGRVSPCNLFTLVIAESGVGKTACDRQVSAAIHQFEADQLSHAKPLIEKHITEHTIWTEKVQGVRKAIRVKAGKGLDTIVETRLLEELISSQHKAPEVPKLILNDATPEAILHSLAEKWPSAGLMSDEGGVLFDSQALSKLPQLNKLWDGDPISKDTVTADNFSALIAQLTIAIQVQPKTFDTFLTKQGSNARDNGFLARFLVCRPQSFQGYRCFDGRSNTWNGFARFEKRLVDILNLHSLGRGPIVRRVLKLSQEATKSWLDFSSRVEFDQREGNYLEDIRDAASKMPEHLARVAAVFHYLDGREGDIQSDSIDQARQICSYFLEEFKRLFGIQNEQPIEIQDAMLLEQWIHKYRQRYQGLMSFRKNEIAQLGPKPLRMSKIRREAALCVLQMNNRAQVEIHSKTHWVVLNPIFFPNLQSAYQTTSRF